MKSAKTQFCANIVCPCGTDLPADLAIDGVFCSPYCREEYHAERPRTSPRRQRAAWLADPDDVTPAWWNDDTAPLPADARLIR